MNWDLATETAHAITQDWTGQNGPGGAILLFDGSTIRVESCGGLADMAHNLPFRPDTASRYASISKHFFATLLLSGTPIGLEDRLGEHLILSEALGAVPVGRALDMTGGLPDLVETLSLLGVKSSTAMNRHQLIDVVQRLEALNFPSGQEISYSNTGYRMIQAGLAAKGIDTAELIQERIARPLGLSIRLVEDETEIMPNLATGYWPSPQGWRSGRYGPHISASGGLAGTAIDLAEWGQALLTDRAPVPGLLARLGTLRHLADGRATGYGLGLARSTLAGRTLFGHGGSLPGYRSHLLLDPETGTGAVVLSNRDDIDAAGLAHRVMAALHGAELPPAATDLLPDGLFVAETGPFWLEHKAGKATFLGATEALSDGGNGFAVGRSAHLPMRLTRDGDGISGEIGHVARSFRKLEARVDANHAWSGRYTAPDGRMSYDVVVTDRTAQLLGGPIATPLALRAIDGDRALAVRSEGPSTQQICLDFSDGDLRLVVNRSRMLRFSRAGSP